MDYGLLFILSYIAFFVVYLTRLGAKSERGKSAHKEVEKHNEAEKIDARPILSLDAVRKRLRKNR